MWELIGRFQTLSLTFSIESNMQYIYINDPQMKSIYLCNWFTFPCPHILFACMCNHVTLQWQIRRIPYCTKWARGNKNKFVQTNGRFSPCQKMNELNLHHVNHSWHKQGGIKEWATFDNPYFTVLTTVDGRDYLQTKWLWVKGLCTLKLNTAGL